MLPVPTGERDLIAFANDLIEKCRVSAGQRAAYCQLMNAICETGRYDGYKSLLNMLYKHIDRTAAHLFSPVELRFCIDFDRVYPKDILEKAAVVGKQVTRQWDRTSCDFLFGEGVFNALKFGACLLKQFPEIEGPEQTPHYTNKLTMPWNFGVWNEAETDLSKQPAMVETITMTLPEVWRRIYHLPGAAALYERIRGNARTGSAPAEPSSFFHQLLSTSQIQTGVQCATRPLPGGIVQLNNDPSYSLMGPMIGGETVECHEIWVQDAEDYTTIIMIEPDILIAPRYKKANLLGVKGRHPYTLIQPNRIANYFWGRSELVDLVEPQQLLSTWLDDARRLTGLQIDKILAFIGEGGPNDETYSQFRGAGYLNMAQGSSVQDLTPKFPPELLEMIKWLIAEINILSGFPEIMQGRGEPGVRAGSHASTLLKTASPTLRDRALLLERQCAMAADLTLSIKEAKDATRYWTKADTLKDVEDTSFLLTDLPEDWRVVVDSHSSSPIFADESEQLIMASLKMGIVDGEYVLDNLPFPDKDKAKAQFREREAKKQQMMQQMLQQQPEIAQKMLQKQMLGGRR